MPIVSLDKKNIWLKKNRLSCAGLQANCLLQPRLPSRWLWLFWFCYSPNKKKIANSSRASVWAPVLKWPDLFLCVGGGCQGWPDLECRNQDSAPRWLQTPAATRNTEEEWQGDDSPLRPHTRGPATVTGRSSHSSEASPGSKSCLLKSPWHRHCHILYVIIAVVGCDREGSQM